MAEAAGRAGAGAGSREYAPPLPRRGARVLEGRGPRGNVGSGARLGGGGRTGEEKRERRGGVPGRSWTPG